MRAGLIVVSLLCATFLLAGCSQSTGSQQSAINHYVQGQILADRGNTAAALAELEQAIRNDPSLSVAHAAIGDIYRKERNYDKARDSYENACRTNPYAFRPHYNLGVTYQYLAEASKNMDKTQEYLGSAVRVYLRAITLEPADFDTNLNLSACYFQMGKYDVAEQYCKSALAMNSKSAPAWSNMGIIYDSQNRLYDAIKAYKTSLEIDTHQPQLLLNLGSTYMRQNRLKPALNVFEMAVKEDPGSCAPWEQIGCCCYHMEDFPQAIQAYQKAIQLNPRSAVAYRGLGIIYFTQYLKDPSKTDLQDKGLAAWNNSLEIQPDQADLVKLVEKYTPKPKDQPL